MITYRLPEKYIKRTSYYIFTCIVNLNFFCSLFWLNPSVHFLSHKLFYIHYKSTYTFLTHFTNFQTEEHWIWRRFTESLNHIESHWITLNHIESHWITLNFKAILFPSLQLLQLEKAKLCINPYFSSKGVLYSTKTLQLYPFFWKPYPSTKTNIAEKMHDI